MPIIWQQKLIYGKFEPTTSYPIGKKLDGWMKFAIIYIWGAMTDYKKIYVFFIKLLRERIHFFN